MMIKKIYTLIKLMTKVAQLYILIIIIKKSHADVFSKSTRG